MPQLRRKLRKRGRMDMISIIKPFLVVSVCLAGHLQAGSLEDMLAENARYREEKAHLRPSPAAIAAPTPAQAAEEVQPAQMQQLVAKVERRPARLISTTAEFPTPCVGLQIVGEVELSRSFEVDGKAWAQFIAPGRPGRVFILPDVRRALVNETPGRRIEITEQMAIRIDKDAGKGIYICK